MAEKAYIGLQDLNNYPTDYFTKPTYQVIEITKSGSHDTGFPITLYTVPAGKVFFLQLAEITATGTSVTGLGREVLATTDVNQPYMIDINGGTPSAGETNTIQGSFTGNKRFYAGTIFMILNQNEQSPAHSGSLSGIEIDIRDVVNRGF